MVVMWCKTCGAIMGMREPLSDWSTDRGGLRPACAKISLPLPPDGKKEPGPPPEPPADGK